MLGKAKPVTNPKKLIFGPYTYLKVRSQKPSFDSFEDGVVPIKADSVNVWIVRRCSAVEHPNYYLTYNFKEFIPLS